MDVEEDPIRISGLSISPRNLREWCCKRVTYPRLHRFWVKFLFCWFPFRFVHPFNLVYVEVAKEKDIVLKPGRLNLLIGRSGCGKSVFMGVLAGFLPSGSKVRGGMTYWGEDVLKKGRRDLDSYGFRDKISSVFPNKNASIVFVPQILPLVKDLKVVDHMRDFARGHGVVGVDRGELEGKFRDELDALDKSIKLDKDLSKLSGGQRRKVELAACKCVIEKKKGPCLLLLDEPTTGLDRCSAKDFFTALKRLIDDPVVGGRLYVILATHVPHFVEEVFGVELFDVFKVNKRDEKDDHIRIEVKMCDKNGGHWSWEEVYGQ